MAQRVYHWKHGWIPLDSSVASRPRPAPEIRQVQQTKGMSAGGLLTQTIEEKIAGAPHVAIITRKNIDPTFKYQPIEVLDQEADAFSPAQKREVAATAEAVFARFPGLHQGLDQQVTAVSGNDTYWGATDGQSRRHQVGLSKLLWSPADVKSQMAIWSMDHGALSGAAKTQKEFRRRTILHEMGHVVHLRAMDRARRTGANPINSLVEERVTPRQMGFTNVPPGEDPRALDQPVPRWAADTLDRKSAYASSSPMEWYAEAFLDGMVNGASASAASKRAIAAADAMFGKGAA